MRSARWSYAIWASAGKPATPVNSLPHIETVPDSSDAPTTGGAASTPASTNGKSISSFFSPHGAFWLRAPLLAATAAAVGIVLIHWNTAASIVAIWIRSETFAHGFVIIPLCAWLIYRKRGSIRSRTAQPWWPGLALVFGAGGLWLVMSIADVLGVTQFALAFMIQAAIVTVVGLQVSRALIFPLAFLLFAIPVGEIFVPTLIEWTADFTIWALRFSGVPVYREANHFVIPSGAWSVVEACSGVRYLIASVMVGTIYAAVTYRSPRRRVYFVAASIVTPILANWLRAYMIVMLGHLSENRIAAGVDHIIYGWVFFGVVMLLLFWIGSFWSEDLDASASSKPPVERLGDNAASGAPETASAGKLFAAAMACLLAAGVWVPLETFVTRDRGQGATAMAPLQAVNGWEPLSTPFTSWKPHYSGYSWDMRQTFRNGDREVGIFVAFYRDQSKGRELVTSGNRLTSLGDFKWKQVSEESEIVVWAGDDVRAERAQILGPEQKLEVVHLFWVDGRVTASMYTAKALLAWSRLKGHGDDSALIAVYSARRPNEQEAAAAIRDFMRSMSPAIERALKDVRAASQ